MAKQFTVNKVYTDAILDKFPFTSHKMRWGSIDQGVPGLNQKFKKWDTATHEAVADAAALRLVTAADRAASMLVPMAGATPEIYVFSATNTDADDGVTTICPADITHPAAGRWVKRSESGSATTMVTETLAAVSADLVMASGGADRTIVATTIDKDDLVTMSALSGGVNRVVVSTGTDKSVQVTTYDYRYNFPHVIVSDPKTIGAGGSTETCFILPTRALVLKAWIDVITPVAGQTVDVGVSGYDLDGYLAAASVNGTGFVDGPTGVLMPDDFGAGGLTVVVTGGAAAAGAVVKVSVLMVEIA